MPPRTKGKSKKELLAEQIAAAVGAGREVAVETVDFSDPNRPKTCLEVDFPIIPINQIAANEGNSGKPIYQMSKWWARRRSSVFRSMLIAAAMKAPDDESKAAKAVWDVYYADHQKRGTLRHLKIAEPFMGGGTTIVEGSRLGMQMFGCDLNPVAWFVVKNEMAQVDIAEVKRLLADIEAEVKPLIMPYYACNGPDGEKGKWFRCSGTKERKKNLVQPNLGEAHQTTNDTEEIGTNSQPTSTYSPCLGRSGNITATKDRKLSTPFGANMVHVSAPDAVIARPSCLLPSSRSKRSRWIHGLGNVPVAKLLSTWNVTRRVWRRIHLSLLRWMKSRLP